MGFKKIRYNTGEEIFKVRIENTSGSLLDNWVFMKDDFPQWVEIMKKKYGLGIKPKKDRDLDWAV